MAANWRRSKVRLLPELLDSLLHLLPRSRSLPTVEPRPHEKSCDGSRAEDLWLFFLNVYGHICSGESLPYFLKPTLLYSRISAFISTLVSCEMLNFDGLILIFALQGCEIFCFLGCFWVYSSCWCAEVYKRDFKIDCGCDAVTSLQHTVGAHPTFE